MKYDVKKNGKATLLTLHGRKLDATVTPELKAELLLICKPKVCSTLVIDMEEVQFCDSSGLSALLIADRTMRSHGGEVHLLHVHEKIRELMRISQLERLFSINDKADEIVKK